MDNPRRHLRTIKRRVDFLINKIAQGVGSDSSLQYDQGEKNALLFLLEEAGYLEDFYALYEEEE